MKAKLLDIDIHHNRAVFQIPYKAVEDFAKHKGEDIELKVAKYRPKKSHQQNAYLWELCDRLASVVGSDKLTVYRRAINSVGAYEDYVMKPEVATPFCKMWSAQGTGWITEIVDRNDDGLLIRAYYGTSKYNKKEMARLIEYIVDDCREVGIVTKTPKEIALMSAEE